MHTTINLHTFRFIETLHLWYFVEISGLPERAVRSRFSVLDVLTSNNDVLGLHDVTDATGNLVAA